MQAAESVESAVKPFAEGFANGEDELVRVNSNKSFIRYFIEKADGLDVSDMEKYTETYRWTKKVRR